MLGCTGIRRSDTNKAQAASPPPGKLRGAGGALTLPQKPPGSGRRLGLAAGTATLPSSLRPGEQASREQGQRPGVLPPAGSPGRAGQRPGLLHCRGEQLLASVVAAAAGSCGSGRDLEAGERAPRKCARVCGRRAPVCVCACVIVARAALLGARKCERERRRCGPKALLLTAPH